MWLPASVLLRSGDVKAAVTHRGREKGEKPGEGTVHVGVAVVLGRR